MKKLLAGILLAASLNGCSVCSAYTGLFRGGEDLAHATERTFAGQTIGKVLAVPAFFGGTIAGPFVAFYWGLFGDAHVVANLDTLADGYLDIPNDNFTLAYYPFTGLRRIEETEQEYSCSR